LETYDESRNGVTEKMATKVMENLSNNRIPNNKYRKN
jgi:hypothetical protein